MGKKIVVITGSPRKNGNSFAMTDAFVEAAEGKGHQVTRFDAAFMDIGGCRACETCFSKGNACSFDDDFNKMAPVIQEADAVVLTPPVYWYTFPMQIKAAIDKWFAFMIGEKDVANKKYALVACCEDNDLAAMDEMRSSLKKSTALLKWELAGEVLVPGVGKQGDVKKTDGLEKAAALADSF